MVRCGILSLKSISLWTLCGVLAAVSTGCGGTPSNEKKVYKVTGSVTVDGKPTGDIQVAFHEAAGFDPKQPASPRAFTTPEGKLVVSTYAEGDGVPAGDYKVTFALQEFNLVARSYAGPDKLKKRYSDPKTTPITVKVSSAPVDMGEIKLTTK